MSFFFLYFISPGQWSATHPISKAARTSSVPQAKQVRLPEEQLAAEQEPPTFRAVDPQQTPYWQAYPTEQPEEDNPPRETALRGYEHWYETRHKGISPPASGTMVFYRLLWVDTKMNHSLHLRPAQRMPHSAREGN